MNRPFTARFRRSRSRAVRSITGGAVAIGLLAGAGTLAAASTTSGWGNARVGSTNSQGTLLASNQRVDPIGSRTLLTNGRIMSSAVSPDGRFIALLSWYDFTGFLTIVDLASGAIVQQMGAPSTPGLGDGTVAADGPLWSPDGATLWVPQTNDLVRLAVAPDGTVSNPQVITLQTTYTNLNTSPTIRPDEPSGMALSGDGSKLYVALNGVNRLGVIDTATNRLVQEIKVGNAPRQVVLDGTTAYVSDEGGRPATTGDTTNQSAGTRIVSDPTTGAATTGTVSVVDLAGGTESSEIPVGLQPTALYLAADHTLMVANSNDDSLSLVDTARNKVVQTVNVNPLPGSTEGSYPNAILMPDAKTLLVSIGRDNALAVFGYSGPSSPVKYEGLLPTDFYPVAIAQANGKIVVSNDRGIGSRGPASTVDKGPGTAPAPESVTGSNTYDDTSSLTQFVMPAATQLGPYTNQVFTDNDWAHLLGEKQGNPSSTPVAIPTRLGNPSAIKHVFVIVRENRTYDQVFGDLGKGDGAPALAQFGATVTPNAHALEGAFTTFDNFYDPSTLSADGHNWIVQADANDYIEKEFGAFYRSYPASGGDALAYQRNGFLWNAVQSAGRSAKDYGEYNNFFTQPSPTPSWSDYYQDSKVMEGKSSGPMPVAPTSVHTYSDVPSLNKISDGEFPPFDLGIPDQYRADIWMQSFRSYEQSGNLPNLNMLWMPDDHTGGSTNPYPVAQVADNDLAVGRIVDAITHSKFWASSAIFVMEDDSQNGVDHVDGHRAPLMVISPYAKHGAVDDTYYNQVSAVRTIEQILGAAPMNQVDRAAEPMYSAFTNTPDLTPFAAVPNQVCLDYGPSSYVDSSGQTQPLPYSSTESCPGGGTAGSAPASSPSASSSRAAAAPAVPASEQQVYEQWMIWQSSGHFSGAGAMEDWADPAQLNRYDWYSAHNWDPARPYPGDKAILSPGQVPGAAGWSADKDG